MLYTENEKERIAGGLALKESNIKEANKLLDDYPQVKKLIDEKQVNWQTL